MITLVYDPHEGNAVRDGDVTQLAKYTIADIENDCNYRDIYSTENIFNEMRLFAIMELFDLDKLRFEFEGQEIAIDRFGDCWPHPEGFLSAGALRSRNLLLGSSNKRAMIKKGEWQS